MQPILETKSISKCYQIRANQPRYLSLRESIGNLMLFKKPKKELLWALKEISFQAMPGESIAIIGKNGAGKSTLLKILSRITPPSSGKAIVRGRMASLLEVGTGFHPELTGRENIFLNGSVMGLKRSEIRRQFDAIADFSGVEKFLETPLKFYSSGMQLRLAFAVAAFLEPEILLLDEVLAVGDADFQKKGLQKMDEVAKSGKTVLFISHNMAAVRDLCKRGIVLERGRIMYSGSAQDSINYYLQEVKANSCAVWENDLDSPNSSQVYLKKIVISDEWSYPKTEFLSSEAVHIQFHTIAFKEITRFTVGFDLLRQGVHIARSRQIDGLPKSVVTKGEENIFICKMPKWFLHEGTYTIRPFMAVHFIEYLSSVHQSLELYIEVQSDPSRSPLHGNLNAENQPGLLFPMFHWDCLPK